MGKPQGQRVKYSDAAPNRHYRLGKGSSTAARLEGQESVHSFQHSARARSDVLIRPGIRQISGAGTARRVSRAGLR